MVLANQSLELRLVPKSYAKTIRENRKRKEELIYLGYVNNVLNGDTVDNYTYTEFVRQKLPDLLHDYPALRGLLSKYSSAKPWLSHIENGLEQWSKFLAWIEAEKIFELNRP